MLRRHLLIANPFNPLQLSPALWLDASDTSTMYQERTGASATTLVSSDADPVGTWRDKSGNGRHFTASSDAVRPTYKVAIQNGKSGIRLDGTDDFMAGSSSISGIKTVGMVVKYNSDTVIKAYGGMFGPTTASSTSKIQMNAAGTTSFYDVYPTDSIFFKNGTTTNETATNAGPMNAYTVCIFSGPTAWDTLTYQIGRDGTQTDRMIYADYCELVVLQTELTENQRKQLTRYLGSKWGISVA